MREKQYDYQVHACMQFLNSSFVTRTPLESAVIREYAHIGSGRKGADAAMFGEKKVMDTLMGSTPFQTYLPKLAAHYLNGNLLLDELVSQEITLEQINEGYAKMAEGKIARSVITFD